MLKVGDAFPRFSLNDENGERMDSTSLCGLRYVLFFIDPHAQGSIRTAQGLASIRPKFSIRNIPVFGVTVGPPEESKAFISAEGLKIKILSDEGGSLGTAVGAWDSIEEDPFHERKRSNKCTFIVGKNGNVEAVWIRNEMDGHAQTVLSKAISLINNGPI